MGRKKSNSPITSLGGRRVQNPGESIAGAAAASAAFHGREAETVTEVSESFTMRGVLAGLGRLEALEVLISDDRAVTIEFNSDTSISSDVDGLQLYIVGGNQQIKNFEQFELDDAETLKDFITLGPVLSVRYYTDKYHLVGSNGFAPYLHHFGEENGALPTLIYDRLNKGLLLAGGSYTVTEGGIKN